MCVGVDVADRACVCVCVQLGGTVGDIESMPFIEAFRQFQFKVRRENFCNIHVSLIPQVGERRLQAVPCSSPAPTPPGTVRHRVFGTLIESWRLTSRP